MRGKSYDLSVGTWHDVWNALVERLVALRLSNAQAQIAAGIAMRMFVGPTAVIPRRTEAAGKFLE